MLRDDDTRPIRPASSLRQLAEPNYGFELGVAKSLWVNDARLVTVHLIAEGDDRPVKINIFGPGLIPVRVKAILAEGTTANDIIAMHG